MIRSFAGKSLRLFAASGDASKLPVQNAMRVARILSALDAAKKPNDMNVPGLKFHALKGKDKGRFSVWVSGNYRITFGWSEQHAIDVNIEDYH